MGNITSGHNKEANQQIAELESTRTASPGSQFGSHNGAALSSADYLRLLQTVLKGVPGGVLVLDHQMNHLFASDRFLESAGFAGQDIIGQNHYQCFPHIPDSWKAAHQASLEGAVTGNAAGEPYTRFDGEQMWVRWEARPWRHDDGRIGGIVIFSESITVERQAREIQARLASIVDASSDAIISTSTDERVVTWNAAAEKLTGFTAMEAAGRPISFFFSNEPNLRPEDFRPGASPRQSQSVLTSRNGRRAFISVSSAPLTDTEGNLLGYSRVVRDLTDQKQFEERLNRQAEELARSNVELERFAYVTSHDLQEPLRTVRSFCQLLLRRFGDRFNDEAGEYLRFIALGSERMSNLISDLLTYSRVSTKGAAFVQVESNVAVWQVVESLAATIVESDAQIEVAEKMPRVWADRAQLGQVFQNLIENAIKFRRGRSPIVDISFDENESEFTFHVKDNGIGISPEYFDRIFIIFQRLHTSEEYRGTGIGLALCKKIVERHGGRIWVESELDKGSVFHFSIPKRGN